MDTLLFTFSIVSLIGSALVAGVFFAFSSFVMDALARLPGKAGIEAMQSINVVVINRSFLGAFIGTAVLSLAAIPVAVLSWGQPWAPFHLAGGLVYLVGSFFVTGLGNVPLNDELAAVDAGAPDAERVWRRYVRRWTVLNHVRGVASALAALLFCLGVVRLGVL